MRGGAAELPAPRVTQTREAGPSGSQPGSGLWAHLPPHLERGAPTCQPMAAGPLPVGASSSPRVR